MAEWTYTDKEGLLEYITVREHYADDILRMRELIAHEGYAIYDTTAAVEIDESGNPLLPRYSGGACLPWLVDINIYAAAPITDDMTVT